MKVKLLFLIILGILTDIYLAVSETVLNNSKMTFLENYFIETLAFIIFMIFLITAVRGIRVNKMIARRLYQQIEPLLASQFSRITLISKSFWMDSWSSFDIFATGRSNCFYLYINITCRPRQDLLTGFLLYPLTHFKDCLYVEIPLDMLDPIVILVCKRNELKSVLTEYPEIEIHCTQKKVVDIPQNWIVYSNSNGAIEKILNGQLIKILNCHQISQSLKFIYISDQTTCPRLTSNYKKIHPCIKASFILDEFSNNLNKNYKETINSIVSVNETITVHETILKLLLSLNDTVQNIKLSERTLQHVTSQRQEIEKTLYKLDESKRLAKFEQKRKEKLQEEAFRINQMTPQHQKKYQEKKARQEAKSKMKIKKIRM
ncbi:hypothetical protein ACR3K2_02560 [Cryptosporidium serpentis]